MDPVTTFLVVPIVCGILGAAIASAKGRTALGWGLCCFLFPILLLVILCLPSVKPPVIIVQQPTQAPANMQQIVYVQVPNGQSLPHNAVVLPQAPQQTIAPPTIDGRIEPRLTRGFFG